MSLSKEDWASSLIVNELLIIYGEVRIMSKELLELLEKFEDVTVENEFEYEEVTVKSALTEHRN